VAAPAAGAAKRDAFLGAPLHVRGWHSSGECGLADRDQQVMPYLSGEHVILLLEPGQLGFQVTYSLLEAAHL
jgi:hypothetical protein